MNVYDMAKFGQLYLNRGVWKGEQIISEQWIEDSTNIQFDRPSGSADYEGSSSIYWQLMKNIVNACQE